MNPTNNLLFVLLWAESLPNEKANRANLIFSPSVTGLVQDPNSHPVESESTRTVEGDELSDPTIDF